MNTKISKLVKAKDWQFYLSRPFSVFGASYWQYWYNSEDALEVLGTASPDVLFLEEEKYVARCYRPKNQVERLNSSAQKVIFNKKRALTLMKEGFEYNKRAIRILAKRDNFKTVGEALDFVCSMGLRSTVLPNRVGEFMKGREKLDSEVLKLTKQLRSISYYPRVIEEVIVPLMTRELKQAGIKQPKVVAELITYKEFRKGKFDIPKNRIELAKESKYYLLSELNGKEEVNILDNSLDIIKELEPKLNFNEIKGSIAFRGLQLGKVRLVSTRSANKVKFNPGEILVSVSTSPIYLPLMRKAGAIVTDEGGLTSHAAILARELKKPTVIGTKIATKVLKDGDVVEVDANKGIVRKIK